MNEVEFKRRTKALGIDVVRLVRMMQRDVASDAIGRQIVRSATSVGANYRVSCRSRSTAEILSRLAVVEEEADETMYWLELLEETGTLPASVTTPIRKEADEIVRMTVASIRTLRARPPRIQNPKSKIQNE